MWIHKYLLTPKEPLNSKTDSNPRLGFFIKDSDFKNHAEVIKTFLQFSDFIHWPELADPEIKDLKLFLMEKAQNDINFPFSLTEPDLMPIKSNGLILSLIQNLGEDLELFKENGFEVLKLKMGRSFKSEYATLMKMNLSHFLLRVDLNSSMNFKEAQESLNMLKKIPNLEYVEDPLNYHDYYWSELQKIVPLALDNLDVEKSGLNNKQKNYQFRLVKPTRGFSLEELLQLSYEGKKIVVTNIMDNVVGAWKVYFYYCELKKHIPHHLATPGFHTHRTFKDYEHTDLLSFNKKNAGPEWHFDNEKLQRLIKILLDLQWTQLHSIDPLGLDKILQKITRDREFGG